MDKSIKSMYCPANSLIVPYTRDEFNMDNSAPTDVVLEHDDTGNQYLHLVFPADKVNFLNGLHDPNSFFGFNNNTFMGVDDHGYESELYDNMLIEVGCKIYEVNKVAYRSTPSVSATPEDELMF